MSNEKSRKINLLLNSFEKIFIVYYKNGVTYFCPYIQREEFVTFFKIKIKQTNRESERNGESEVGSVC